MFRLFPYSTGYYDGISEASGSSAREILPCIVELLRPRSFLEVGCGTGSWTKAAMDLGISDCLAVDGPWVSSKDLVIPPETFAQHDLNNSVSIGRRFDLAISLEVAEHLQAAAADQFVRTLTNHSDAILFGAAPPMQGGTHHVNEQWPDYWIKKFEKSDFRCFDLVRPKFWANESVAPFYIQNSYIFLRNGSHSELTERLEKMITDLYASPHRMTFIHPRQYTGIASMEMISARLMLRQAPKVLFKRLAGRLGIG
jgi:hypothetical protein